MKYNSNYLPKTFALFLLCMACGLSALADDTGKKIYTPWGFGDFNNESSQYCYARSKESEHFVLFWEAGYGSDPRTTSDTQYRVDVDAVLRIAETSFNMYADSLKFIIRGRSKTDTYKMIILLEYSRDWKAEGSGRDDVIGLLTLSSWGAQALGTTVAHEVGHCFQYQVHCDGWPGGWMYGFGSNGSGGNCFWEQCAQWQAFKVFPEQQFTDYRFTEYLNNAHKHIIHEGPRYANYFIMDYWCDLHGMDFLGRLWRESRNPEDPIDAYKRITGVTQAKFNDEIYDCAARFATWDVPSMRFYGAGKIDSRSQTKMNRMDDGFWQIDSTQCIENYGYNIIKLNAPSRKTDVSVTLEGQLRASGFRSKERTQAGWRFGFVALLQDGTRVYSDMVSRSYTTKDLIANSNPIDSLTFECPDNCSKLWLVVTGAPKKHWHHAWDDDDKNDEQWPYRVKLTNTNLMGVYEFNPEDTPRDTTIVTRVTMAPLTSSSQPYPSVAVQTDLEALCRAFCMNVSDIQTALNSSTIRFAAVSGVTGNLSYASTATAPGHWFNHLGNVTTWGTNSYLFSEFNKSSFLFHIGQYPNKCKEGSSFTIKQALVYTTPSKKVVRATFAFEVTISSTTGVEDIESESDVAPIVEATYVTHEIRMTEVYPSILVVGMNGRICKQAFHTDAVEVSDLAPGYYFVKVGKTTTIIYKK